MDGVFGGPAAPFSTVAAVHLGSLAERTGGCFLDWEKERVGSSRFLGTSSVRALDAPGPSRAMSLSCHDRPRGCGLDLGCEVKPASKRVTPVSAAWWWRVVWKELCHVGSHPCFWVWCWIGSGGWV